MTSLIDTSSLLALVRYYLPFDESGHVQRFVEQLVASGEILVLDAVAIQCRYVRGGIVATLLPGIVGDANSNIVDTRELIPPKRFYSMLENQFCNQDAKRLMGISEVEFENYKNIYLNDPDCKLLLYSVVRRDLNPIIVTEETAAANDSKLFKKIPDCCRSIEIECCGIVELFRDHYNVNLAELIKSGGAGI